MPPLTKRSLFWHLVRVIVYTKFVQFLKKNLVKNKSFKKYGVLLALFVGTAIYKCFSKLIDLILCKMLNMKTLKPFDEFFLYDDPNSLSNVCMVLNFQERFDSEKLSKYYLNKI